MRREGENQDAMFYQDWIMEWILDASYQHPGTLPGHELDITGYYWKLIQVAYLMRSVLSGSIANKIYHSGGHREPPLRTAA